MKSSCSVISSVCLYIWFATIIPSIPSHRDTAERFTGKSETSIWLCVVIIKWQIYFSRAISRLSISVICQLGCKLSSGSSIRVNIWQTCCLYFDIFNRRSGLKLQSAVVFWYKPFLRFFSHWITCITWNLASNDSCLSFFDSRILK